MIFIKMCHLFASISKQFIRNVYHKVGCVFSMVISSDFRMGRHRDSAIRKTRPTLRWAILYGNMADRLSGLSSG